MSFTLRMFNSLCRSLVGVRTSQRKISFNNLFCIFLNFWQKSFGASSIKLNTILNPRINKRKVDLPGCFSSYKILYLVENTKIFHQWLTQEVDMFMPIQIFINKHTKIFCMIDPLYNNIINLNLPKVKWHRFIVLYEIIQNKFYHYL